MYRAQLEARRLIYQRISIKDVGFSGAKMAQIGDWVQWVDVYDEAVASSEILQISGNTFITSDKLIFNSGTGYKFSITD